MVQAGGLGSHRHSAPPAHTASALLTEFRRVAARVDQPAGAPGAGVGLGSGSHRTPCSLSSPQQAQCASQEAAPRRGSSQRPGKGRGGAEMSQTPLQGSRVRQGLPEVRVSDGVTGRNQCRGHRQCGGVQLASLAHATCCHRARRSPPPAPTAACWPGCPSCLRHGTSTPPASGA